MSKTTIGWRVKNGDYYARPSIGDKDGWEWGVCAPMTLSQAAKVFLGMIAFYDRGEMAMDWSPDDIRLVRVVRRARLCPKCGKGGGK